MTDFFYNEGGAPYGADSTIGDQIVQEAYWRKAIVDAQRDMYFMPLAEVKDMPRNSGKTMKANVYYPVLDDRNLADEGIDALGNAIGQDPAKFYIYIQTNTGNHQVLPDATDPGTLTGNEAGWDFYATARAALEAYAATLVGGAYVTLDEALEAFTGLYSIDNGGGNLYSGSRDPGVIGSKLPALSEGAQRVNRIGSNRVIIEGSIEQFGFFTEYTEDSLMFDTDAELLMHITTEMMHAAVEVTEDMLQRDLLSSAESSGTVKYGGSATAKVELTGLADDQVSYDDFVNLSIELDLNRTPKHTTILTGSRFFDTRTVNSARFMYVQPEAVPYLESLTDYHGNKAMIEVRHYEGQTATMNGEVGTVGSFRIIVNPEMQYYANAGATGAGTATRTDDTTTDRCNVYPFLVVGEDSFSTIGFMSDGKRANTKFKIHNLRPGADSVTLENPYGNKGLMSIRWWYGFLLKRPERLAVMLTTLPVVAPTQ
jgi:N4-gp56 family major capsid protein